MIPTGAIIERVQGMIGDKSTETKVDIRNHLNAAYFDIAATRPWNALTVEWTNNGTTLPSDMIMPIYAQDNTDYLYFRIGIPERYFSQRLYNYFINLTVTSALFSGTDGATTINSTTFTSATAAFDSTVVGEYLRVGSNLGFYKIASRTDANTIVLEKAFRGADLTDPDTPANLTGQYYEVRPVGTQKIAQTDENGDTITPSAFKMWYLQRPLPLYNDYDMILLPGTCEAVFIKTCQLMLQNTKYENDSLRRVQDYQIELDKMRQLDPIPKRFVCPRDKLGERVAYGRTRVRQAMSIHYREF